MKNGREGGGDFDPRKKAREDLIKEIFASNATRARFLSTELDHAVNDSELKAFLSGPVSLSKKVDGESVYQLLAFADSVFYEGATSNGFEPVLDKYLGANSHAFESSWIDRFGYDPILLESEISRFRAIVLAACPHMSRSEFQTYIRQQFLYCAARVMHDVPSSLLIRLSPEHREALANSAKESSEIADTVLDRLLKTTRERIKRMGDYEADRIKKLTEDGTHPAFAERFVKNSRDESPDHLDIVSVYKSYPNPEDLIFDLLGNEFSIIVNKYYQHIEQNS